jgi:hypothetical protein
MDASFSELYINAIIHYWSFGTMLPEYEKDERLPLFEKTKYTVLDFGTYKDLQDIYNNLIQSKTSLSETDKEDLVCLIRSGRFTLPDEIPFKENVALVVKLLIEESPKTPNINSLSKFIKTATDVLRVITAMSDGDISLAKNCRYKSFKRKERKLLVELLDNCGNIEEDMLRYQNKWIRIGERLHPSEYNFNKVSVAFDKLRNNDKDIKTFNIFGLLYKSNRVNGI